MKRLILALTVSTFAVATAAYAQSSTTQTKPPQTTPPAQQTPPVKPPPLIPPTNPANPPANPANPAPNKPVTPPPPFPPDSKLGVFSFQQLIQESDLGKLGQKTMKDKADQLSGPITALQKQAQQLNQEITTQANLLSGSVLANKQAELEKLSREIQNKQQDMNTDLQNLQDQLIQNFQDKVLPIVEALAKEKSLYMVFSVDNSGAAYVYPGLDLTPEIIKRLNALPKK